MADKGLEGREAGRQVSRMQSGEIGERVAGKKNSAKFYPVTTIRKIHLDLLKTKPKRKTKKPKM